MGLQDFQEEPTKANENRLRMDEMWIFYKAKPHELKNRTKKYTRPSLCKICGKPLKDDTHDLCYSCNKFISQKRYEERKGNK